MRCFSNVVALFLNYLHANTFNLKRLRQVHSASSNNSFTFFFAIFKVNVKKKGVGKLMNFKKIEIC